jgi:acyl-CoA thioester hydrolase
VARHEIDYVRPLVHRHEPVVVEVWVTQIRAASLTVAYEIRDAEGSETVYVRASTVVVPYDLQEQRPRRITAEEKAYLRKYLDDGGDGSGGGPDEPDEPDEEEALAA